MATTESRLAKNNQAAREKVTRSHPGYSCTHMFPHNTHMHFPQEPRPTAEKTNF